MTISTRTLVSALIDRGMTSGRGAMDYASDYGEPGYRKNSSADPDSVVLFGDWWCTCENGPEGTYAPDDPVFAGRGKLHGMEYHYPRTFAALEQRGCELEWSDEWVAVNDRAYRTQADSYSWEPSAVFDPDTGEYLIVGEDLDAWLSFAVNDPHRCIMSHAFSDEQYAAAGFTERTCELESGWYGREDDPETILAEIQSREDSDVLFVLSGTEQFRVTFCVYVRPRESADVL